MPFFLKSCLVKIILELASKRSLKHLRAQIFFQVPRFGLVCGLIQVVFNLTMCVLRRWQGKDINRKRAMLLAACFSALPAIVGFTPKELSLFKLFLFPLVCRCLVTKASEIGMIPYLTRHNDIIGYMIATSIVGFCYTIESYST